MFQTFGQIFCRKIIPVYLPAPTVGRCSKTGSTLFGAFARNYFIVSNENNIGDAEINVANGWPGAHELESWLALPKGNITQNSQKSKICSKIIPPVNRDRPGAYDVSYICDIT